MTDKPGRSPQPIGQLAAALLAFNGVVGASIFVLPGLVSREFGAFGPWLFPLFGILMLVVALPLAAVAARFDVSGGPAAYVDEAFGPLAGFQAGWLYYIAKVTALAANSTVFAAYAVGLFDGGALAKAAVIIALIGTLALTNLFGLTGAVRLLGWASLAKAAPLILFAGAGLWLLSDALGPAGPLPPLSAVEASALVLFYAFVGFENAMIPAGETRDARRAIPRALTRTILLTALLYFVVQLAYTAVAPVGSDEAPMIAFGAAIAGPAGGVIMTLTALASLLGNLNGNMITSPRLSGAMAERAMLPGWIGRPSRWQTPGNGIGLFAGLALLLALSGSFVLLAVVGTVARLLMYLAVYAALPRLRAKAGEQALPPPVLALAMLAGAAICLWAMAQSTAQAWALTGACIGLGALLYALSRREKR